MKVIYAKVIKLNACGDVTTFTDPLIKNIKENKGMNKGNIQKKGRGKKRRERKKGKEREKTCNPVCLTRFSFFYESNKKLGDD